MGNPQLKPLRTPFAYGLSSKVYRVDSGCAVRVDCIPQNVRFRRKHEHHFTQNPQVTAELLQRHQFMGPVCAWQKCTAIRCTPYLCAFKKRYMSQV